MPDNPTSKIGLAKSAFPGNHRIVKCVQVVKFATAAYADIAHVCICGIHWQLASEWQRWLHILLLTARSLPLRRPACRFAYAHQQEGVPVDRATWRGDLSLRASSDAPRKSATGPAGPAGEGPNVTSSQDSALTRLDRQPSRQLHEQDYFPNGNLTDPEVKSFDL